MKLLDFILLCVLVMAFAIAAYQLGLNSLYWHKNSVSGVYHLRKRWWAKELTILSVPKRGVSAPKRRRRWQSIGFAPIVLLLLPATVITVLCSLMSTVGKDIAFIFILFVFSVQIMYYLGVSKAKQSLEQ